jgi:hypothetical protein
MSLKWKAIININIIILKMIHAAIDFSENHIKKYEFLFKISKIHNEFFK